MMPRAATRLGRLSLTDPLDTRKCCRHRDIHFTLSFSRRVRGLGDCRAPSPCSGSFAHAVLLALSVAGAPEAGKGRTWTDPRSLQRELAPDTESGARAELGPPGHEGTQPSVVRCHGQLGTPAQPPACALRTRCSVAEPCWAGTAGHCPSNPTLSRGHSGTEPQRCLPLPLVPPPSRSTPLPVPCALASSPRRT